MKNDNSKKQRPRPRKASGKVKREQPRKDSSGRRVNFDNERESKFEKFEKDAAKRGECNDISWYAANPELLKAAASLPFSTVVGENLPFSVQASVPGIYTIFWDPYVNGGNRAAINQAANSIYSYIVHANSRNYAYNQSDLMILILAGMQVFSLYAHGLRAYGTMRKFDQRNYYTPKALVTAMGFKYEDLRDNLSKMWFDLNELSARLQQIWIPNVMPVMERWFWMNSNIYKDGNSVKSQLYLFVPTHYFVYDETMSEFGSALRGNLFGGSVTWSTYMQYMNASIDALLQSEDRGMIFGDILNAYGADKLYSVNSISADYVVEPTYNVEVLTQIENCVAFRGGINSVLQDANHNIYAETYAFNREQILAGRFASQVQVLNFHQLETPTPDQIMVATRLKASGAKVTTVVTGTTPSYRLEPVAAGTELVTGLAYWNYDYTTSVPTLKQNSVQSFAGNTAFLSNDAICNYAAFDWAPWLYGSAPASNPPADPIPVGTDLSDTVRFAFGDYDQYTLIDAATLAKMHTTAVYSEFGIPTSLT